MPRSSRRASKRPRRPSRQQLQPQRRGPQPPRLQLLQTPILLREANLHRQRRQLGHRRQAHNFCSVLLFLRSLIPEFREKTSLVRPWRRKTTSVTRASSFSFPKDRRLTHPAEFDHVKQSGSTRGGKLLGLNFAPVESSAPCRIGFIVSRRIGGAVVRNRVRRRLREIVRRHQHDLRSGFWIVLVARRDAVSASYHQLEHELLRLARRASILL